MLVNDLWPEWDAATGNPEWGKYMVRKSRNARSMYNNKIYFYLRPRKSTINTRKAPLGVAYLMIQ